tara:strand:- start:4116 stop:4520 length:405 start_codon:yes stop_codon:yes gene_type:complete
MSDKKVCFTNGCFDTIHRGHIELLKFCKENSDYVVVGLNSDKSVKLNKGESRPYNNQEDRKLVLEALRYVDEVIIYDEQTPLELVKKVQPDLLVKGSDYADKKVVGRGIAKEVILFGYINGYSSTDTIQNITDR